MVLIETKCFLKKWSGHEYHLTLGTSIILPSITLLTDLETSSGSVPIAAASLEHSATGSALGMHWTVICDII